MLQVGDYIKILWSIFSIFGNSLTIISIAKFEFLRNPTNILLANLAFADMNHIWSWVCGAILQTRHDRFILGWYKYVCLLQEIIEQLCLANNVVSVFMISIDRFIAVMFPLQYSIINTQRRVLGASAVFGFI